MRRVYSIVGFEGHYPVGTAAVVVASSKRHAAALLEDILSSRGLPQTIDPDDFVIVPNDVGYIAILCNGDY